MAEPDVAQEALDRAGEEKNLLLVYQPIHDARTGEIYSAEALLRQWRQSGEIREASIITGAAERGPGLFKLDSWTLRTAFTEAARWPTRINVNLSPREFQEGNVLPRLTKLLTASSIDPHKINLEITEVSFIDDPEETMEILHELKKLGIQLWLDDFGTGHSSITHLQRFPVDGLKISGEFVRSVPGDRRSTAITRALIDLAHDLSITVVAEEVERQEQLDFLLHCTCDYIQGFLFSKPMTREDFERLILGTPHGAFDVPNV